MEDLFDVSRVSPDSTTRATSATPRSPVSHRSAATCSTTRTASSGGITRTAATSTAEGSTMTIRSIDLEGEPRRRPPSDRSDDGRNGGRAGRLGPRRTSLAALVAVALVAVTVVVLTRSSSAPVRSTYGGIPSWLPQPKVKVGRLVHASAAHPWLAVEGDTVAVSLAHGHALVTAVSALRSPRRGGPRCPRPRLAASS